jgi:hypothetical protein
MSLDMETNKKYRELSALPVETRSVRPTGALMQARARADMSQQLTALQTGTERTRISNALANEKADQRLANRDALGALGVTAINTGLQGLSAYEKLKMQVEQEKHNRMISDFYTAFGNAMNEDRRAVINMLSTGQVPLANTPSYQEQL